MKIWISLWMVALFSGAGFGESLVLEGGSNWMPTADAVYSNAVIGWSSASNTIALTSGVSVIVSNTTTIGRDIGADGNEVTIGDGASWTNGDVVIVGYLAQGNRIAVNAGATFCAYNVTVGNSPSAEKNEVVVSGEGTELEVTKALNLGGAGYENRVGVSDGAVLVAQNDLSVGYKEGAHANRLELMSGSELVAAPDRARLRLLIGNKAGTYSNIVSVAGGSRVTTDFIQVGSSGSYNTLLLTGAGTVCTNTDEMWVGKYAVGNRMEIRDGARLVTQTGNVGDSNTSISNRVLVSGADAVWESTDVLRVGNNSTAAHLRLEKGGQAVAGKYEQSSSATLELVCSTNSGRLVVAGEAQLAGALDVSIAEGVDVTNGAIFALFEWGSSVVGEFEEIALPALPEGLSWWNVTNLYSSGELVVTNLYEADYLAWKEAYSISAFTGADDRDDDGFSNWAEYISGSNPTNALSVFQLYSSAENATWSALSNRLYRLYYTGSLTNAFSPLSGWIEGAPGMCTNGVGAAQDSGFYRLDVMLK